MLRGGVRHELACASCGAALHNLKMLRKDKNVSRDASQILIERIRRDKSKPSPRRRRKKKAKPRRSYARWALNEAFETLEDIFD